MNQGKKKGKGKNIGIKECDLYIPETREFREGLCKGFCEGFEDDGKKKRSRRNHPNLLIPISLLSLVASSESFSTSIFISNSFTTGKGIWFPRRFLIFNFFGSFGIFFNTQLNGVLKKWYRISNLYRKKEKKPHTQVEILSWQDISSCIKVKVRYALGLLNKVMFRIVRWCSDKLVWKCWPLNKEASKIPKPSSPSTLFQSHLKLKNHRGGSCNGVKGRKR